MRITDVLEKTAPNRDALGRRIRQRCPVIQKRDEAIHGEAGTIDSVAQVRHYDQAEEPGTLRPAPRPRGLTGQAMGGLQAEVPMLLKVGVRITLMIRTLSPTTTTSPATEHTP